MVPIPRHEETKKELTPKELLYRLFHASNVYQPQEVLGGHPAIEFVLGRKELCDSSITKSPGRTQPSYMHLTYDPEDDDDMVILHSFNQYSIMVADSMEVHNDLSMKNMVGTCLDFNHQLIDRANFFIDLILSQPHSYHYQSMLMGLFDQIEEMKSPLLSYAKFFKSSFAELNGPTTFTRPFIKTQWAY